VVGNPKTKYSQKYKEIWEKELSWLLKGGYEDKVLGEDGKVIRSVRKAKCTVCLFTFSERIDIRDLREHGKSKAHLDRTQELLESDNPLDSFLSRAAAESEALEKQRLALKVARAEARLCAWAAAHNVPFNELDHLIEILAEIFDDSKVANSIRLKRTKATYITVHGLGREESEDLVTRMKKDFFSIAIDESTDVSVVKSLALMVRMLNREKKDIEECLLTLTNPAQGTAVSICDSIDEVFALHEIPWVNCVGFGADTCNVMQGEAGGVKAELKRRHGLMCAVGCVCHLLALSASGAAKVCVKSVN
jgi:hypothetical protein